MRVKIIFFISVLSAAFAIPLADQNAFNNSNCISMTLANDLKINAIVNEITDFLADLAARYEEFDIRQLKINIDKHSDNEDTNKETVLDVTINDCQKYHTKPDPKYEVDDDVDLNSDENVIIDDRYNLKARFENERKNTVAQKNKEDMTKELEVVDQEEVTNKPQIVCLDLSENDEELFRRFVTERRDRPFFMYIIGRDK